jgi:hypothetical protein
MFIVLTWVLKGFLSCHVGPKESGGSLVRAPSFQLDLKRTNVVTDPEEKQETLCSWKGFCSAFQPVVEKRES